MKISSMLLMGAAAYGLYKYTKMSEEDKKNLVSKGKKMYDDNVPENIKNLFGGNGKPKNEYQQQV